MNSSSIILLMICLWAETGKTTSAGKHTTYSQLLNIHIIIAIIKYFCCIRMLYKIVLMLLLFLVCKARNQVTVNKHLGSTFHFRCRENSRKVEKHQYIHYNQTTGKPDLINVAPTLTQRLSSFEDGGDYCCSDHRTHDSRVSSTTSECCISVASKTNINVCATILLIHVNCVPI